MARWQVREREAATDFLGFPCREMSRRRLRQVSAAYGALLGIVESADVAPSADAAAASEKWEAAGKATLARWEAIQTKDLTRVNSLLEKDTLATLERKRKSPVPDWRVHSRDIAGSRTKAFNIMEKPERDIWAGRGLYESKNKDASPEEDSP